MTACGIDAAIDRVHTDADGQEEKEPAPDFFPQQILASKTAEQQEHDDVDELEGPHGLQAYEIVEVRAGAEEKKCGGGDEAEQQQRAREPNRGGSKGRYAEAGDKKEHQKRQHDAGALVPRPCPGNEEGARVER